MSIYCKLEKKKRKKSFFVWTSTNTETYYNCTATKQHRYLTLLLKNVLYFVVLKQKKHVFLKKYLF